MPFSFRPQIFSSPLIGSTESAHHIIYRPFENSRTVFEGLVHTAHSQSMAQTLSNFGLQPLPKTERDYLG